MNLETLWAGLRKTLRRGKTALQAVKSDPGTESLHELRKRGKDLRYQLTLLRQPWKEVIGGYSDSAKDLEQRLGEDHNLAVIRETVLANPAAFGSKKNIRTLLRYVDERRSKLQGEAIRVASLLYAEKASDWRSRLERSFQDATG